MNKQDTSASVRGAVYGSLLFVMLACLLPTGCAWPGRNQLRGDAARGATAEPGSQLRKPGDGSGLSSVSDQGRQIERNLGF